MWGKIMGNADENVFKKSIISFKPKKKFPVGLILLVRQSINIFIFWGEGFTSSLIKNIYNIIHNDLIMY